VRPRYAAILPPSDAIDLKKVSDILSLCGVDVVESPKNFFSGTLFLVVYGEECELRLCGLPTQIVYDSFDVVSNIEQDFARLLRKEDSIRNHVAEFNLSVALQSLACILAEWKLLSDTSLFHSCTLQLYPIESFLRLDKASFAALNLLPKEGDGRVYPIFFLRNRAPTSLFGLLNRCRTSIGSRRLVGWITQPLVDIEAIGKRHDIVEAFLQENELRQTLQATYLKKVPDLDKLISKFHRVNGGVSVSKSHLTLDDVVKLFDCLLDCRKLLDMLTHYMGLHRDTLEELITSPLKECMDGSILFIQLIERTVDLKEAENGNYVISREFDPRLQELADEKETVLEKLENLRQQCEMDLFGEYSSSSGRRGRTRDEKDVVRILEDNSFGFVLRVTKKDQPVVQARKQQYTPIRLNKTEYLFTTHAFKLQCKAYERCCSEYRTCQSAVSIIDVWDVLLFRFKGFWNGLVEKSLTIASTYWPMVEKLADVLSLVDILASFALVSSSAPSPYIRPEIPRKGMRSINYFMHLVDIGDKTVENKGIKMGCFSNLHLVASRHALLEMQPQCKAFIANDVCMDPVSSRLHVITGPNMGGKSTYIRQVALTVLLCQIGCFVPCQSARIPIFSQIMCRVGASDSQLRGVSTFLAEMIEAAAILNTANATSLVLVDELGRGTSTFEGFGLAWAIAKHLLEEIKCFCLFATHFHEMGELSNEYEGAVNCHVTAAIVDNKLETKKLTFLYQIKENCCDQSYGVAVAKMAGIPEEVRLNLFVVRKAQQKSEELEFIEKWQAENSQPFSSRDTLPPPLKKLKVLLVDLFTKTSADEFYHNAMENVERLDASAVIHMDRVNQEIQ
ncbi:MutS domain V domain-containing protein, partial [Cardiosporidium cionae]